MLKSSYLQSYIQAVSPIKWASQNQNPDSTKALSNTLNITYIFPKVISNISIAEFI